MVNIIVNSDPRYNINKDSIKMAVSEILKKFRIAGRITLGINIVGDRKMHELNRQFRKVDSTTNILSFALEDPIPTKIGFVAAPDRWLRLGDIVISYPQAVEDAAADGISVDSEIRNLISHGLNHLLGIHPNNHV